MSVKYQGILHHGSEAFQTGKSISVSEVVETVDEQALAREIHHLNALIPEQVAASVLQNFCQAAAQLMAMGYAVVLKNGNDAAIRIYPDIHIKGGNINLARAKELDPTVTDLTKENAGDLVTKAGVTLRAKAEVEKPLTDALKKQEVSLHLNEKKEIPRLDRTEGGSGNGNQGGDDDNTEL